MEPAEFSSLRKLLGMSRKELAAVLGISRKAVESYEQGWRRVPAHVERLFFFLAFKTRESRLGKAGSCWDLRSCPEAVRATCMTWLTGEGRYCWFFTGRLCAARTARAPAAEEGIASCRTCSVFADMAARIRENDDEGATPCP